MRLPLETVIETNQKSLYAAAFNVCKNAEDAEDILQETFLAYHLSAKQFQTEEHLRAWLLRVAINKAKDVTRSFWRRNRQTLEDYTEGLVFPNEESKELFGAVMNLPEKYRTVIHLYYYEDYSTREIAGILRLSEANVRVRLSRGRTLLKGELKEGWNDDEQGEIQAGFRCASDLR